MGKIIALNHLSRYIALLGGTLPRRPPAACRHPRRRREQPPGLRSGGRRRLRGLRPILGGGTVEFVAAGVGAALAQGVRLLLARLRVNAFALTVVSRSSPRWSRVICLRLDAAYPEQALAASVLLMVPGVPLITSVLDFSSNDLVSGVTRGTLAFLLALSIGIGMVMTLWLTGLNIVP